MSNRCSLASCHEKNANSLLLMPPTTFDFVSVTVFSVGWVYQRICCRIEQTLDAAYRRTLEGVANAD